MKQLLIMIVLLAFAALCFNSCGSSGGGSSSSLQVSSHKTTVTINLGQTKSLSSHTNGRFVTQTSAIPPAVVSIRLTVTAPDMNPISQVIDVAGRSAVSLSFELQNGQNRDFVAEAMDISNNVLYRGETFANLEGVPLHLTMVMVSVDPLPPVFAGLSDITDITETSMKLSWSPATDEVTPQNQIVYLIFLSTTPLTAQAQGASTPPSYVTDPGATSFTITGLTPNTLYYVQVLAMDQKGNRDSNNVIKSARTKIPPDTTPPDFKGLDKAEALSDSEIQLTWVAATDNKTPQAEIRYLIYMSVTSGITPGEGPFAKENFTVKGDTSIITGGLSSNTTYYFIVRAMDNDNNVDSNKVEKSAKTTLPLDKEPPKFLNGLGLSVQAISPTQVLIIWNPASDDQTDPSNLIYIIYRSSTPEGVYSSPYITLPPGTWKTSSKISSFLRIKASTISYTVDGLTPDTNNCFGVNAQDQAGNPTTNTETACVRTPKPEDKESPSVPTGVTATADSSSQITIKWNASTDNVGVTGYNIYRKDKLPSPIQSISGTSTSDTGLSPSTEYCYSVSAVDAVPNESAKSAEVCAKTKTPDDTTPPTAPTGLTATAVSSSQINLSWAASTDNVGVVGYKVYRNGQVVASSKKYGAVAIAAITTTNYSDTTGLPNTQYCYQVTAYDAVPNESAPSNQACATTQAAPITPDTTPPTAPTGLTATAASSSQINLSWFQSFDNVGVARYDIYRNGVWIKSALGTSAFDNGLSPSTEYCYSVQAIDSSGNASAMSLSACATTFAPLPDLSISRIWDSCGDGCDAFDVKNGGPLDATGVTVYALNGYLGTPTNCQGFFNVAVSALKFITLDTYINVLGSLDYYIIIDPANAIAESNKTNNTACSGLFCTSPPVWPTAFSICFLN